MSELFFSIGSIIIVSTILAYAGKLIKQPTVLAYILTGILLGPGILKIIQTREPIISALSDIGIAFLLFIVGLELSYKKLKDLGKNALILGIGQIIITLSLGYLTVLALGFRNIEAVYIAIALTFSSTIIVVKLLSEKNDVNSIYGKMSISTLLIQDFFAIFVLVFLASVKIETTLTNLIVFTFLKMLIITIAIWLFAKYLIPVLFQKVSKNQELLFLSSISLCFLFAIITEYYKLGLEIGAFSAGLVLASTPYNNEIIARVRSLKDFFITMFFVILGSGLVFRIGYDAIFPLIVLVLFVLFIKPLIIFIISNFRGFKSSTSYFTGTSLGQISEFSLIIFAIGLSLGHVSNNAFAIVTILGVITIVISTYLIDNNRILFQKLASTLLRFEYKKLNKSLSSLPKKWNNEIVLLGARRTGSKIIKSLKKEKKRILIIDHDPGIIQKLKKQNYNCIYGDLKDHEILDLVDFKNTQALISTINEFEDNKFLVKKTKKVNSKCLVFLVANTTEEALDLYDEGADYVLIPQLIGGSHVSLILQEATENITNLISRRIEHIHELKKSSF